mmetsp:Transcript_23797/g.47375  ORF Transcript_23797/g.47375 Transcript_23797/m.47375 type:complete len:268 (-) Transcript_23797:17-820(-)
MQGPNLTLGHVISLILIIFSCVVFLRHSHVVAYISKLAERTSSGDKEEPDLSAMLIYVVSFVCTSLALIPQTSIEVMAGVIWHRHPAVAFGLALTGKLLASWSCFFVGRAFLSSSFAAGSERRPMLSALERVFEMKPHLLTFLVCLAWLPASVKFYGMGSIHPAIRWWPHFCLWSTVAALPYAFASVLLGISAATAGTADASSGQTWPIVLGASSTLFLLVSLGMWTKKELERQLESLLEKEVKGGGGEGLLEKEVKDGGGEGYGAI